MSRTQEIMLPRWAFWARWWPVALATFLLAAVAALWLAWPRAGVYDPARLAAVRVGMTKAEVEETLGRPLPAPEGQEVGTRSSRPVRAFAPDLIEEEGLFLT